MLPAKYRLNDKKIFNSVFRSGKTVSSKLLILRFRKDLGSKKKVGFSVGLKFSKKAFQRNRVKRWMREAARSQIESMEPGSQIIFLINPKYPYEQVSCDLIFRESEKLLKEAKILQ
jgi:ribonuclease P protein component